MAKCERGDGNITIEMERGGGRRYGEERRERCLQSKPKPALMHRRRTLPTCPPKKKRGRGVPRQREGPLGRRGMEGGTGRWKGGALYGSRAGRGCKGSLGGRGASPLPSPSQAGATTGQTALPLSRHLPAGETTPTAILGEGTAAWLPPHCGTGVPAPAREAPVPEEKARGR